MSTHFKAALVFSVLLLCIGTLPVSGFAAAWIQVGEKIIDSSQLELEFQRVLPMSVGFHGKISPEKIDTIRNEAESRVIERVYQANYADLNGLSAREDEVLDDYRRYLSTLSQQQIDKMLAVFGKDNLVDSVRLRLNAARAVEAAVDMKVHVGESEIADYYEENKTSFRQPPLYRASHILLKVDPAAPGEEKQAVRDKAEALMLKARAGENFYNLAYYNSDDRSRYVGGDLGRFHQGQTVREFDEAMAELEVGEISDPVRTLYGYHIIKMTEKQPARQLDLKEAAPLIRKSLEKKRREALYSAWMEQLRIEYPLEKLQQ